MLATVDGHRAGGFILRLRAIVEPLGDQHRTWIDSGISSTYDVAGHGTYWSVDMQEDQIRGSLVGRGPAETVETDSPGRMSLSKRFLKALMLMKKFRLRRGQVIRTYPFNGLIRGLASPGMVLIDPPTKLGPIGRVCLGAGDPGIIEVEHRAHDKRGVIKAGMRVKLAEPTASLTTDLQRIGNDFGIVLRRQEAGRASKG